MRKDYGAKWTRSASSVSNKDYINELKSIYLLMKLNILNLSSIF